MRTRRSATRSRTVASACTSPTRSGSTSASRSARPSSFFRQRHPEVCQQYDATGERDEPGEDQPLVPALAHRVRERPPEQDHDADHEPGPDHEDRCEHEQALPIGSGCHHPLHRSYPESGPMPDTNYTSGDDYIVEFLGYRFSFNAEDFEERVVGAAVKLGLVEANELEDEETADLVALAAQGLIEEPESRLGRYLSRNWERV